MILGKGLFRVFFNKLNTIDLILNSILAFCISVFSFYVFLPNTGYTSLTDFFTGDSIYADYNKYFDISFVFLYITIFFLSGIVYSVVKDFTFNKHNKIHKRFSKLIYAVQYLMLAGYLLLYPTDGNVYPMLALFIIGLIAAGIYDIRKKQSLTENDCKIRLSVIALNAIILICFGRIYCFQPFTIDAHHDAEHLTAFYMHTKYCMQYYKDIMLVHGYRDLAESLIGINLFGGESLYNYLLGKTLYYNLLLLIFTTLAYIVFKGSPAMLIPFAALYKNDDLTLLFGIYILVFFAMLKDKIFKNNALFLSLYLIFAFLFTQYWTTMGFLWTIAVLPSALYILITTIKNKEYKRLLYPAGIFLALLLVNIKDIYYFLIQAGFYTKANLFGFGTVMPPLNPKNTSLYFKLAPILAVPAGMVLLAKEFLKKETKNIKYILILIFTLVFVLFSLNYTTGRIDADSFTRLVVISVNMIFIILPFAIYQNNKDNLFLKYSAIVLIFLFTTVFAQKIIDIQGIKKIPGTQIIEKLNFSKHNIKTGMARDSITDITRFIAEYTKKEDVLWDLTNQGILYYLLDKKIPVPYTSYYNIVSPAQSKYTLSILKKNPPSVIYIDDVIVKLDRLYPSLRINPIYRYLMLDGNYKLITDESKNKALLIKSDKQVKFNNKELVLLDKFLAASNLQYLPDSWGKSAKKLPMQEISLKYALQGIRMHDADIVNIHLEKPVKGSDIDLLYIETAVYGETNWVIQINGSPSLLYFSSKAGKLLIPFDNYPSWLLNEAVTDITIKTTAQINAEPVIKFYKRSD